MRTIDALHTLCHEHGILDALSRAQLESFTVSALLPALRERPTSSARPTTFLRPEALAPLHVCRRTDGTVEIIDGHTRMAALDPSCSAPVHCMVIPGLDDGFPTALARMLLNVHRPCTVAEKLHYARVAARADISGTHRDTVLSCLAETRAEEKNLACAVHLDERCFSALCTERIDMHAACVLLRWDLASRHAFIDTFSSLRLSRHHLMDILEWSEEIASARGDVPAAVCRSPDIVAAVCDSTRNGPQRLDRVKSILSHTRFPRLSRAQRHWRQLVARCNPDPSRITFAHAPSFEKNQCTITVRVTTAHDAKNLFLELGRIDETSWNGLISPQA